MEFTKEQIENLSKQLNKHMAAAADFCICGSKLAAKSELVSAEAVVNVMQMRIRYARTLVR